MTSTDYEAEDWFGLDWTDWIRLNPTNDLSDVPSSAGLYRVRHRDKDGLEYIGETGRTRGRVRALARESLRDVMHFRDPHTAAPCLWAVRDATGPGLEISITTPGLAENDQRRKGLEAALISRFDLIFTVTDQPDPDEDARLAEHILETNYAGELRTQRAELSNAEATDAEIEEATREVEPSIDAELFRKYIAYAKRSCYPKMTDEARETIRDFYVDMRSRGIDEDSPVPITARKIEALVRLAEASARVRLSDTVEAADAERVVDIVRSSMEDIGVDPETGQFDADVVETGTSKSQRDRIKNLKGLIQDIEDEYEEGAPIDEVLDRADEVGMDRSKAEQEIENLKKKGEVYEPSLDHLRTT